MADIIELARRKLADQSADLINKAKMPALLVSNLLFEAATAVALTVVDIDVVAHAFREHADSLDEIGEEKGAFQKPGPFIC
jgi:hypothetical protein